MVYQKYHKVFGYVYPFHIGPFPRQPKPSPTWHLPRLDLYMAWAMAHFVHVEVQIFFLSKLEVLTFCFFSFVSCSFNFCENIVEYFWPKFNDWRESYVFKRKKTRDQWYYDGYSGHHNPTYRCQDRELPLARFNALRLWFILGLIAATKQNSMSVLVLYIHWVVLSFVSLFSTVFVVLFSIYVSNFGYELL